MQATASWLTCEVMCIPAKDVTFALPVTIVGQEQQAELSPFAPLSIARYTERHPADVASIDTLSFDGALSQTALKYNEPFKVAFSVTPVGDATLARAKTGGRSMADIYANCLQRRVLC